MSTPQDNPNGQGWSAPGGKDSEAGQPNQYGNPQQNAYGQPDQGDHGYQAAQPSGYAYPTQGGETYAGAPTDKGPAPKEVMRAYHLILAAGALYLLSAIVSALITDVPDVAGASVGIGLGMVFAVVVAAVYVVLAVFIRKGHNWARITATVLAALNALGLLSTFLLLPLMQQMSEAAAQPMPETSGLNLGLSVIVTLLGVAGVVMTYLKPARPYFAPRQLGY